MTKHYALHIPFKGFWSIHPVKGCGWVKKPADATLFTFEEVSRWVAEAGPDARFQYVLEATQHPQYCDDCGECIPQGECLWVDNIPCDINSANKGESACLCHNCHESLHNNP